VQISRDSFVERDEQRRSLISRDSFVERDEQRRSLISTDLFIEIGDHVQQPSVRHPARRDQSPDEEQRSQGRLSQRQARVWTSERAEKILKEVAIR